MPVQYEKSGGQGHKYQVPDYPEAADGPKAFKDYSDYLDLLLPPVGTILPFAGSTDLTGWLICDGREVSAATYPKLAAICGTKFGTAAAGSFKLPNLKGRSIVGLDSSQTEFDTIGKTGGAKSVTLTVSNMPQHSHSVPNHTHTGTPTGLTATAAGEAAHTHGSGTLTIPSSGAHDHTGGSLNQFVTDMSWSQDSTQSGSGVQRAHTISETKDFVTILVTNSGAHTHSISGSTAAGSSHTHSITIGGTLSLDSSGATTTGNAGSATPTGVDNMSPYLTLNHIIRAA